MAEEQDVFISGISGSIQQWGTEATATKMEQTLQKIHAQNSAMTQLLTALKNGESVTQKQTAQAVNATKGTTKATEKATVKESQGTTRTHGLLSGLSQSVKDGWSGNSNSIIDQLRKNQLEATRLEKDTQRLINAGMSRDDAVSTLKSEKRAEQQAGFFKKAAVGVIALATGAEEASQAGFDVRFDMASELRQSGLMDGINGLNEGFISIAQTISETGFTFGQAAEFTKQFSEAVGVKGVKGTLDFVNNMARGPGMYMEQFSMEFGQVAHISGEYLDSLRIAGQLQGRDRQQLRIGMDDFMSNVQSTANVLKISMEQAATILKNALSDDQKGMIATLPEEMREAILATAQMGMAQDNPIMKLLATRLAAGENNFIQTQEFQDMSSTMGGQELIKFVQQAAQVLEIQGKEEFKSFMANQGVQFSQDLIELFSQSGNRAVGISDGFMSTVGQVAEGFQNLASFDQGVSGGNNQPGGEDNAAMLQRDGQVQAQVSQELAINSLMPGFIDNVRNLTDTNRAFAEQAAKTIIQNANIIDGFSNAVTGVKEVVVDIGNLSLKIMNIPGIIGDFTGGLFGVDGVFSNDTRTVTDFTSNKDGGLRTMNDKQSIKFEKYTTDMITAIKENEDSSRREKAAAAQTLKNTLDSIMRGKVAEGSTEVDATQQRILAQLTALLKELRE
tara:strand:- start:223 stop:2247 length:2025 start_codon:yes stop_codon:yes gene_type:complete